MNFYEVIFIIKAELEDALKDEIVELVKKIVSEGGEVLNVSIWGNKKFAYQIQKRDNGFYVLMTFKAKPELPRELDRRLKILDNILRYIIVSITEEEAKKTKTDNIEKKIEEVAKESTLIEESPISAGKEEAAKESTLTEESPASAGTELTDDYQAIGTKKEEEEKASFEADRADERLHQNVHIDAVEHSAEVLDKEAIKEEREAEVDKDENEEDSYLRKKEF